MRRVNDKELRHLWSTRLSDKEIAARLGHHLGVIRRRAGVLGLKPRRIIWQESGEVDWGSDVGNEIIR